MYKEKCIKEIRFQGYKVAELQNFKKQNISFDSTEYERVPLTLFFAAKKKYGYVADHRRFTHREDIASKSGKGTLLEVIESKTTPLKSQQIKPYKSLGRRISNQDKQEKVNHQGIPRQNAQTQNMTESLLTPYTFLAPAFAANMERIPVPLPTSRTILSLKTCLL